MKSCAHTSCNNPVFSGGFCRNHQYKNPKSDRRSFAQKYQDNLKAGKVNKAKPDKKTLRETVEDLSLQYLILDLDAIFSKYIRLKYADASGMVKCFTCPKVLPISQMQNGHYESRSNLSTRFLEANCRVQCSYCNSSHETDKAPFANALELENKGIVEFLEEQAREVAKPTRDELKGMIADYRAKVKVLERKLKK